MGVNLVTIVRSFSIHDETFPPTRTMCKTAASRPESTG